MNLRSARLFVAALIILGIVIIGFAVSVPHTKELQVANNETAATVVPEVTIKDTYKKGTHTITGTLVAPDACMSVSAEASLLGDASSTQSVLVEVSMPEDTGVCLIRPTERTFSTSIEAPEGAIINVMVNGVVASTTFK